VISGEPVGEEKGRGNVTDEKAGKQEEKIDFLGVKQRGVLPILDKHAVSPSFRSPKKRG